MYVIKLEIDKQLNTITRDTIYQGEDGAHTLHFILPKIYGNQIVSDCSVLMRAILPNGTEFTKELTTSKTAYKDNYFIYALKLDRALTCATGIIKIWLSIVSMKDNLVLKSNATFLNIVPAEADIDWLPDDLDPTEIIENKIEELEAEKADDISYDDETNNIMLTSGGNAIGNGLPVSSFIGDNLTAISALNDAGLIAPIADETGAVLTDSADNIFIY